MPVPKLTPAALQAVVPHATPQSVALFFHPLTRCMEDAAINTPLRAAHFLAQIAHESGELRYTEELASGAIYEDRHDLGNTYPGDGVRFKGRGLLQITGRTNYQALGAFVGRDLLSGDNPGLVATDPSLASVSATWFWNTHNLNKLADADDIEAITRRINGGLNGLISRKAYLARAKTVLMDGLPSIVPMLHAVAANAGEWTSHTL